MNEIDALLEVYNEETSFISSTTDMENVPSFRKLTKIGEDALPAIFNKLLKEPDTFAGMHSFVLLQKITKTFPPLKENERGKVLIIKDKWVQWGKDHGFLE